MGDGGGIILEVDSLVAGYGKKQVLNGVTLDVRPREIMAVIGHNGAGKSTLLKAIFGLIPIWSGQIQYKGREFKTPEPRAMIDAGMTYVPQGNRVFGDLTVRNNLEVAGATLGSRQARRAGIEKSLKEYEVLQHRVKQRAATLSGGEKQMLALAMSLVLSPRMILLDEPSLGLAPPLVTEALGRIRSTSRKQGVSVLIVEQKVREVLKIADRVCVLRSGSVSFMGDAADLRDEQALRSLYL